MLLRNTLNNLLCWIGIVILIVESCYSDHNPEVTLKHGVLSGKLEKTLLKKRDYHAFRGVPYAEPPIGTLRFLPPKPHQGWKGTYESHTIKPTCMQFNSRSRNGEPMGLSGSEDCLYLSVFTPSLQGQKPIVVFDYNDNFRTGFNSTDTYSPDFFLEEDVIVVTINHRLDLFGYLTTSDEVIPPNAGLKDFILALQWIRENIEQFGGDPNRVTLMGSRGGAALIHILLFSEKAKGLFSSVIMQSGTALEPIYFPSNSRHKAFMLGEQIDVSTEDSQTLLEELQKADAEKLFYKIVDLLDDKDINELQMSIFPFTPVVENDNSDAVLTSLPDNSNIINDVPILIGFNSREGLDLAFHYISSPRLVELTHEFFIHFPIRSGFRFDRNSTVFKEMEQEIKEFYFRDGYFHVGNILEYAVYVGDVLHNYALDYTVGKLANQLSSPLFYYMFDFKGALSENSLYISRAALNSVKNWGATVGDELCYLHVCTRIRKNYESLTKLVSEQAEIKLLRRMVRMWTNFIKTGNPTPDEKDDTLKKITWTPVNMDSKEKQYLHITKAPRMKAGPLSERAAFWENLLKKYSAMVVDGVVKDPEPSREEL
ncbi:venom carboxylesterase-6-like [Leguminivora glycinivorella]|uniref:venom carboxylesterase-6-like n=1 Tax=Leguminivora glycinivorella TaxID=1035111 RepID=UPI002010A8F6|nr:venom carboxylesterase-6-like [Leguminivora glycinivorella]